MCTLWCFRGVTSASLKSVHGSRTLTGQHFSIRGRNNAFTKNDLHDETAKWNDSSSCSSNRSLPHGLKDVSIDINRGSCNKITKELSSPKIYEGSVGQGVEIREHDQLQCGQFWCKLYGANGCACIGYFMIRS